MCRLLCSYETCWWSVVNCDFETSGTFGGETLVLTGAAFGFDVLESSVSVRLSPVCLMSCWHLT